jgi:PadR family transcriptional regulator, regulatory protein PadR
MRYYEPALRPYGESTYMSVEKRGGEGNPRRWSKDGIHMDARPKNWLVPVTLAMLSECSSYGYDIMERAVEFGFEAVNPGTVYRTLRKMEKDGLCESEWETDSSSGGPARRVYSITDAGGAYLDLWVRSMERYQQTMDDWLLAYKRGMSPS